MALGVVLAAGGVEPGRRGVPGVLDVLADLGRIERAERALGVPAASEEFIGAGGVEVEDPVGEEVAAALPQLEVPGEGSRDGVGVGDHDVVDEVADLGKERAELAYLRARDVLRRAAGYEDRAAGEPAAEYRAHLVGLAADGQRLDVVVDEGDGRLAAHHVGSRRTRRPRRDVEDPRRVDVVERGEVVEVQDVRLEKVRAQYEVADYPAVIRHRRAESALEHVARRHPVRDRAHPADPLRVVHRVERVVARKHRLEAAKHRARRLRVDHLLHAAHHGDGQLHVEVPLDARDRAELDRVAGRAAGTSGSTRTACSAGATSTAGTSGTTSASGAAACVATSTSGAAGAASAAAAGPVLAVLVAALTLRASECRSLCH